MKCFVVIDSEIGVGVAKEYVREVPVGRKLKLGRSTLQLLGTHAPTVSRVQVSLEITDEGLVITRYGRNPTYLSTSGGERRVDLHEDVLVTTEEELPTIWLVKSKYPVHIYFE